MAGLLDLPPELLTNIFLLAAPPSSTLSTPSLLSLSLVRRPLVPLARALLWRRLTLCDSAHIGLVLASSQLAEYAAQVRSVEFVPRDADGSARGGVGRGIGTGETVDGREVGRLLGRLRELWEEGDECGGVRRLDVASVEGLRVELLEGEWLSDLRDLTIGTGFLLPTNRTPSPLVFSFRLRSLTLHNNHWQSLPPDVLTAILRTALPHDEQDEEGGLRHLDLTATYDVAGFGPFLEPLARMPLRDEAGASNAVQMGTRGEFVLSTLTSLLLPPFETAAHLDFAFSALSLCSPSLSTSHLPTGSNASLATVDIHSEGAPRWPQRLRYLELPPLSSATSGTYDALWAVVALLLRGTDSGASDGLEEVGLRGWATGALVETAKAVLAAAGLDARSPPGGGDGTQLRRLRFTRLLVPEELGRLPGGEGAELLDLTDLHGVEVACGPREVELEL
ncbi:hypothetical protein JCM10450v2_001055 [Rhodotorula kratochvilovae]